MEQYTLRPEPMYPGKMTDENIRRIFEGAADFNVRKLQCGKFILYAYAIDGLISSDSASEYIIQPVMEQLSGENMEELYEKALLGVVVNSVAKPCADLDAVATFLVNGLWWCVPVPGRTYCVFPRF